MSELDPSSLTEIIRRALESRVNDIHVSLPGQVQTYDSSTQTVDVLPMVTRPLPTLDGDNVFEPLPVIPNCRVSFPRSKKFSLTFPLEHGDEGLLVFTGWDIANWLNSGDVSDPIDLRLHHPGNAIFFPGLCSDGNTIAPDPGTDALVLSGADVRLGDVSASDFVALASLVKGELTKIATAFSSFIPGTPGTGGSPPSFPSAYTSASDVKATKVKAK